MFTFASHKNLAIQHWSESTNDHLIKLSHTGPKRVDHPYC